MMSKQKQIEWAVVGAGPAGIATVGKLLDSGVSADCIAWVDPAFQVGDLGTKWPSVPSNTCADLFCRFLTVCQSFGFNDCKEKFKLMELPAKDTCDLQHVAVPLQWVTDQLRQRVNAIEATVEKLELVENAWQIKTSGEVINAKAVVLAIGAEPRIMSHPGVELIRLEDALTPERLATSCDANDNIAVFGSSHSAILVLRYLLELPVNRVINFYKSPLKYAVPLDDWIMFDNTGLKGDAAKWAREHIDGKQPEHLSRFLSTEENIEQHLPSCNKVVYAVGFDRRHIPVEGLSTLSYNHSYGIIAPGLFGTGIAFPEGQFNQFGDFEYRVGLWKFMDYIDRVMPLWLRYTC